MFDKYRPEDLVWVRIPGEQGREGHVLSRRLKSADGQPMYQVAVEGRGHLFVHEDILRPRHLGDRRPGTLRGWWRVFPDRGA
jgi:hypothetical protein